MNLKRAILSKMGREKLKAALEVLQLNGVDRRSVEEMTARLSRAHRATPALLIRYLCEAEVKGVCERLKVTAQGRRAALIEHLLETKTEPSEVAPKLIGQPREYSQPGTPSVTKRPTPQEVTMNGK